MLAAGSAFGQFEVLAKLKSGGMATLFLARRVGSSGFKRHVAIKVVHEHLAEDASFVRMFVEEALLQARIHHPNVVHVEELGEQDGQHFLVMEYVHGCSLAQLMTGLAKRDRRLTPEMAGSIAAQVLAGLHAAHELRDERGAAMGVVHRDVSPQNVLLAYEGHVKLIDFGVAKAKNRQSTSGGSLKGKLRYMAPEQAFGRAVDRRSDVYALGIVLWEMLTLRRLFYAEEDLALLDMVRHPVIVPPSEHVPAVSAAMDAVVMKSLALRPEDRFATAQEMRRAIAEAMPAALMLDAPNLAELLAAVMQGEIDRDRAQLPQSVSVVVANAERRQAVADRGDEALKTMTISAAGLDYLGEVSEPGRPSASGVRAQDADVPAAASGSASGAPIAPPVVARTAPPLVSRSGSSTDIRPPSSELASPALAHATALGQPPAAGRTTARRGAMAAVGLIVIALVIAGGVMFSMRSADDMVATPLEPVAGPGEVVTPAPSAVTSGGVLQRDQEAPAAAVAEATAEAAAAAEATAVAQAAAVAEAATERAAAEAAARRVERGRVEDDANDRGTDGASRPRPRPRPRDETPVRRPGGIPLADEF